jgi:hypothetical protein
MFFHEEIFCELLVNNKIQKCFPLNALEFCIYIYICLICEIFLCNYDISKILYLLSQNKVIVG